MGHGYRGLWYRGNFDGNGLSKMGKGELMHLGNGSLVKCDWVHGSQGHQVMDNRSQVIGDV
jgi:hypothetical protein